MAEVLAVALMELRDLATLQVTLLLTPHCPRQFARVLCGE
jgi:hypothetical protein